MSPALGAWGARFAKLREDRGLTQEDAGGPDLSHQWISEVEGGQLDPPLTKAAALVESLGGRLVITARDPWTALDLAIDVLPGSVNHLKRSLRALVRAEQLGGKEEGRSKARAAGSSR